MRIYLGLAELLKNKNNLPNVGWLFVEKSFGTTSKDDILRKSFFVAENGDEEIRAERTHKAWLESPTFLDILNVKIQSNPIASPDEFLEAIIYYLEQDTFMG